MVIRVGTALLLFITVWDKPGHGQGVVQRQSTGGRTLPSKQRNILQERTRGRDG
jgi:hypothetical protein